MLPSELGCRDSGFRDVANLGHRAKHSRHHTKDKQRSSRRWLRMIPSLGAMLRYSAMFYDIVRCSFGSGAQCRSTTN
jgi:hypothetical protein